MDETIRGKFNGKLMEFYYKSFLPMDDIQRLEDEARIEAEAEKSSDAVAAASMPAGDAGGMDQSQPPQM